ncbi:tetratricopeptide repeat protein [Gymnodinialimonas hymeniacidonis]|uniref:tetratricopeptide repeat protein n=1 Tax=Gymnodinialimonas hymeniacidonis TaxID=3126508 RepID=UPI0034C6D24E
MPRNLFLSLAPLALSACLGEPRLDSGLPDLEGLNVPSTVDGYEEGIDGLIVGDRLMSNGEYELALRAYYRAAAEDGLNIDLVTAIGAANLALGRLGQAEDQFRRAIATQPDFVPALNNLGATLIERGEYGEARRILEQAFALDSGSSETIRDNLRLAIALQENQVYSDEEEHNRPGLIRRGGGVYTLTAGV